MIGKIRGRNVTYAVQHLQTPNGGCASDQRTIANCLAECIAHNSSTKHYSAKFQKHKQIIESQNLSFKSNNLETYNEPFSLLELSRSLQQCHHTAVGPDEIHYAFIQHLPNTVLSILLDSFNSIWSLETFPSCWRQAVIIPVAKPGKDPTIPNNYRPIALTSCLCKTFERMVNQRLVWFLESNHLLSANQSGFRQNRSTLDHLVSLETFIRDSFVRGDHVFTVFFDLEKAYDTTWKHGILIDLHNMGLRGRLPTFIMNFLSEREFRVRIGSVLSDPHPQEMGVPQGSILSVTLFIVKINSITQVLPSHVHRSLFVDDFTVSCAGRTTLNVQRQLQMILNKIQEWADKNGFKFSQTKTVCVHFCNQRRIHDDPVLTLNGSDIPLADKTKFLGLTFDKKLNFKDHIEFTRKKCVSPLNLLKVLAHFNWGADRKVLLQLFQSLIRSKIEYGLIVYGAARSSYIKRLEAVINSALRICLGAYRTSPIHSLQVEANEIPLKCRIDQLSLQYATKLVSNQSNPTYEVVFKPNNRQLYSSKKSYIQPFPYRVEDQMGTICNCPVTHHVIPDIPPWHLIQPEIDLTLTSLKKDSISPLAIRQKFEEALSYYPADRIIFTDGSKSDDSVGCSFYSSGLKLKMRLPCQMSVFTAELVAILSVLKFIESIEDEDQFVVCSDSLSGIMAIHGMDIKHPYILQILTLATNIFNQGKSVVLMWCPSHVGIPGNERADSLAKEALSSAKFAELPVPASDLKPIITGFVKNEWQQLWDNQSHNKLRAIMPTIGAWPKCQRSNRREEIVLARLRIGHTSLTHNYLPRGDLQPVCYACACPLTVQHILVDCIDFIHVRRKYFNVSSLRQLFEEINPSKIFGFLKEIGLFYRI